MPDPLRSRFQDKQPKREISFAPDTDTAPAGSVNMLTYVGQIVLLLFTIACAGTFVYWLLSDASGEYRGTNRQLGNITISLVRHPANVTGQLIVGNQKPLPLAQGDIAHQEKIKLTFQADRGPDQLNYAVVTGKFVDGTLKGSITDGGQNFPITLHRDPLASMFKQIQEYLPFAS